MELNINYNEIIELVKRLPKKQFLKLLNELHLINEKDQQPKLPEESLGDKLLRRPVMDDEQYESFKNNRKYFNEWRNL